MMGIFYLARTFCVFVCFDLCAVCTMSLLRRQLRGFPPTWLAYWIRPGPFRASARGGAGDSRVGSKKLSRQTSGLFIALSPAPPTAPSSKLRMDSARVFFMCSQLVLAGTKTACCYSEQPAWTAWIPQPKAMQRISCTGRWCCCASSLGHTCPMVSVTARVFD